ncbi:MAG: WecB/TagA/CpsF family glycosyltransferase [Pleurocapsa sp. MO_192.B19]|nr:WecB/TagA/CpsF family glycosyltransferase [Pleurocapsa sp. MO_192.B19]
MLSDVESAKVESVKVESAKYESIKSKFSSVYLLNRRLNLATTDTIVEAIYTSCKQKAKITVSNYNVHAFNLSMLLPQFLAFQQNADITVCDGMGMLQGLKLKGVCVSSHHRVPLTLMIPKLLDKCERHKLSVFLLGSKPQILETALNNEKVKHPALKIAGHHGYFDHNDPVENQTVIEKINQFQPDILIVGMGMPLQELWIQNNYQNLKALVMIPCGAVIDRLAGLVPNSPQWMSDMGLEWLFRLMREPKRLAARYLLGNSLFLLNLFWAKYHDFYSIQTSKNQIKEDIPQSNTNQVIDSKTNLIGTKINYS